MKQPEKDIEAYKTIGEVAKELNLFDKNTGRLQTHTIRFWESQFKQVKPSVKAGKRRYYSKSNIKILKTIKYLLKDKGYTINGVKKLLSENSIQSLDDNEQLGLYKQNFIKTNLIKGKLKKISNIISQLKKLK